MTLLVSALLLLQFWVRNDVSELRQYLGQGYVSTVQTLNARNYILLRNTEPLAPAQAVEMRERMKTPNALPAGNPILSTRVDNVGQGLVSFLFEDDFLTEQVNFVFCPARSDMPERVMALQVLFDDSHALGPVITLLQTVYQLPTPVPPSANYQPALNYPIRPNLPLTIWDLGAVEILYQPVFGNPLITGQFWLADKRIVEQCASIPKLTKTDAGMTP